jgi:hypothetical protein
VATRICTFGYTPVGREAVGFWSNTHHVLIFDGGGGFSAVPKTAMGEFELQVQHAWPEFK